MRTSSLYNVGVYSNPSGVYLNRVFGWMGLGLALTSFISYLIYYTPSIFALFLNNQGTTNLGFIGIFLPFIFVPLMFKSLYNLSYFILITLFLGFSIIMGISQSIIFMAYSNESIYNTYNVVALMFSAMGIFCHVTKSGTKQSLSFLTMLIAGIIFAMLINFFLEDNLTTLVFSSICVISFNAVTFWKVSTIDSFAQEANRKPELNAKLGIIGALTLYLNFINIILFIRKIFRI
jgi:FtsH-binding integral membrane protein